MNWSLSNLLNLFSRKKNQELLFFYRCGLERESLRVDSKGNLSLKAHPKSFGSPLTHPFISTDFGEAQVEWMTPPLTTFAKSEKFLEHLMTYSYEKIGDELFWPYSFPCILPKDEDIQIAKYGSSYLAKTKEIYRKALKYRYGTAVQMISGIHFNFSFTNPFWEYLYREINPTESFSSFVNHSYFHLMRNFLRESWLLTYLFGASPAMNRSLLKDVPKDLDLLDQETLFGRYATSLRMSSYGYYSCIQHQLSISYNGFNNYLSDMEYAIATPKEEYKKIGIYRGDEQIQLNDHILQIENEHYARIRPKCILQGKETPLQGLKKRGVEYIEIRSIDLNPFNLLGISEQQLLFFHQFLLYCLFKRSPQITQEEAKSLTSNQIRIALEGRNPKLDLLSKGEKILKEMEPIALLLNNGYVENLKKQKEKLHNPQLTPSAQVIHELLTNKENIGSFSLRYAKAHRKIFQKKLLPLKMREKLDKSSEASLFATQVLETKSEIFLQGYETLELSTQILIREAKKHQIEVEVLDWSDNFLKLSKGEKVEYVKQATITSIDSYITFHILQNKHITKKVLAQSGFQVPKGKFYNTMQEALEAYPEFSTNKIVVKPKSTNYGIGVFFIYPHEPYQYEFAIREAFQHENSVIVEEFCEGEEYRFLIIGNRVEGVLRRDPANVIGDGISTIKQLVHRKNHDPFFYRDPKIVLKLTSVEKEILASQNLTIHSIPAKGIQIFLRYTSNISTGGDPIDCTDEIASGYKDIALYATRTSGAKICGVDMIIKSPKHAPTKNNYSIIELNYNPALFIHAFPYIGKKRNVAKPLLQLLGLI